MAKASKTTVTAPTTATPAVGTTPFGQPVGPQNLGAFAPPTAPAATAKRGGFGVNPTAVTRAGVAGRVIAAHGITHGITTAMVAIVDATFGVANATESGICLRNAWHAIAAYHGGMANVPAGATQPATNATT